MTFPHAAGGRWYCCRGSDVRSLQSSTWLIAACNQGHFLDSETADTRDVYPTEKHLLLYTHR